MLIVDEEIITRLVIEIMQNLVQGERKFVLALTQWNRCIGNRLAHIEQ